MTFLRRYRSLLLSGNWTFVFTDETWCYKGGTGKEGKSWQDVDVRSCPNDKKSTGPRYIIIDAGSREGFIQGVGNVWCSSKKPSEFDDYHGDMNKEIFRTFLENLLCSLESPSVIVLDNASYHTFQATISYIYA